MDYDYDGASISSDLQLMPPRNYRAFGAGCAQALVADFGDVVPAHVLPGPALEEMAGTCWQAVAAADGEAAAVAAAVAAAMAALEEVIDGDHYEELGAGEHVVAGLYYALQCLRDDEAATAELVSGNLYEAADYIAGVDTPWTPVPGPVQPLLGHPVVQAVLKKIHDLMALLRPAPGTAPPTDLAAVRDLSRTRVR